ncbi:MAG: helix-turn-helix transcriptional regulator [Eubacteriales bacterium]|nr:helix-turn-helix transcriptional regulator [Eubacteriales bacterium]
MGMNERIRKIRKEFDLTQQEFSRRIGTTANVLTNYETGRRNPSASVINNICKTFNINEKWLRDGEGEMFLPASSFSFDEFLQQHDADELEAAILRAYFELPTTQRKEVLSSLLQIANKCRSVSPDF